MQKIPTLFERDWNGNRSRVLNQVHVGCEWVLAGEGYATRKLDGTCCLIRDAKLYKRRELRKDETKPILFEPAGYDEETGKTVGWIPCSDGPEDRWHRAAFIENQLGLVGWLDGTYELVGPKIQGNPERRIMHELILHGSIVEQNVPRDYDSLRLWLAGRDIEGIVFYHPDGRRAKIKLRDFGFKRGEIQ